MKLDPVKTNQRALAAVGLSRTPQGRCLNWVWTMYGAVTSIAPALGHMTTAQSSWEVEPGKIFNERPPTDWIVPVYFGPSTTRTDALAGAGDVTIHIGGGKLVATDVLGAVISYTTIDARAAQTQRPYLGYSTTLGGHDIGEYGSHPSNVPAQLTAIGAKKLDTLRLVRMTGGKIYLVNFAEASAVHVSNDAQVKLLTAVGIKLTKNLYDQKAVLNNFTVKG